MAKKVKDTGGALSAGPGCSSGISTSEFLGAIAARPNATTARSSSSMRPLRNLTLRTLQPASITQNFAKGSEDSVTLNPVSISWAGVGLPRVFAILSLRVEPGSKSLQLKFYPPPLSEVLTPHGGSSKALYYVSYIFWLRFRASKYPLKVWGSVSLRQVKGVRLGGLTWTLQVLFFFFFGGGGGELIH